jgi:hypothetical protein
MDMICSLAQLDEERLDEVRSMEKKLGKNLLAFSCSDVAVDAVDDGELAQIRGLEEKLGLSLVAVK